MKHCIGLQAPRSPFLPIRWLDMDVLYFEAAKRDINILRVGDVLSEQRHRPTYSYMNLYSSFVGRVSPSLSAHSN